MHIVEDRRPRMRVEQAAIVGLLLLTQWVAGMVRAAEPASGRPIRVLFIGNSLTYVNDLPGELQALVAAAYPSGPQLRYESVSPGGYTLQRHWNEGKATAKIAEGRWDYVVVQEQSQIPFTDRNQVYQYARFFDREIKKVGARTVLYMTFPLKKKFVDGDLLPEIYSTLGKELGAIVVPVDLAWHEAAKRDPRIVLYKPDGIHPAAAGTYLAACCFAETLWGKPAKPFPAKLLRGNPENKPVIDLDERQALALQRAAAAVVSPAAKDAVKPAPTVAAGAGWVDLFNGKDTAAWIDDQSLWKVKNGTLIGTGGNGYLDTKRMDFTNVRIRVEAMINDQGNSGVVFRAGPDGGCEAQIEANGHDQAKTGSLYAYNGKRYSAKVALKESPAPANRWFTMDVVADGSHITIAVDGKTVADYWDDRTASAGRIRLQVANARTLVKFRKVQVLEIR